MKTMIELFVRVLGMCEAMLDEERCWVMEICCSVFEVTEKVDWSMVMLENLKRKYIGQLDIVQVFGDTFEGLLEMM